MPIMSLSLSPEVPLEQVEFMQIGRRDPVAGEGELYLYRPRTPLAPTTTYEATLEIGYTDGTGQEHRATRVWQFTTSDVPKHDYANQVVLPLVPAPAEGFGALMQGELVVEGRCLYLSREDGSKTLPIFEEGTVWWEGDTFFYHGNRYEVGDTVAMGGGEVPLDSRMLIQEPDASCDTRSVWITNG
jgi:hypothetical protein